MITSDQRGCQAKQMTQALKPRLQIVDPEGNERSCATGLLGRLAARDPGLAKALSG
jgi:hypothetical protein